MSTSICRNCGLYNPGDAPACGRCGAPLSASGGATGTGPAWSPTPASAAAPSAKRSNAGTIAIVVAIVAVFGVAVVGIVAAIAIPSLIRARAAANEAATIGTLRSIASAEATFASRNHRFGSISELVQQRLLDESISDGMVRYSYRIRQVKVSDTGFEFAAEPLPQATAGDRAYNVTEDFRIRYREGDEAPKGTSGTLLK